MVQEQKKIIERKTRKQIEEEKRHTKKVTLITVIACSLVLLLVVGYIVLKVEPNYQRFVDEVEFVKTLGWEPEGAEVEYTGRFAKDNTEEWKNLFCWIDYESEPWNNTKGYIWYTNEGEWYFEEYIDTGD